MPRKTDHLNATQAAKELGVAPSTVCEWVAAGVFPGTTRLGRRFRIPAAEVRRVKEDGFSHDDIEARAA